MTSELKVHVGETMDDIGARAIGAWHRMTRGQEVNEKHVSFATWETMVRILSPKRLELLRHVHQTPAKNIRALALALDRNYRRVHEDVEALAEAGLLDRDKEGLRAEYNSFDVDMRIVLHVVQKEPNMTDKRLFVERRAQGDYAVRRGNSERASAVLPTQAEAIARARELNPDTAPLVERVRNTETGGRDQWRKA